MTDRRTTRFDALWTGIDPDTKAFCDELVNDGAMWEATRVAARRWLRSCAERGLSTSLDAEFSDPALAAHLEACLTAAPPSGVPGDDTLHIVQLRPALKLYALAHARGRRRTGPPVVPEYVRGWEVKAETARAHLPAADRRKLQKIDELIRDSSVRQWQGLGVTTSKGLDGRRHKPTVAHTTAGNLIDTVDAFLRHAYTAKWRPFTLAALLTPRRIAQFLYYSATYAGQRRGIRTIERQEDLLLDFFYRGREAWPPSKRVVVLTAKQDARIRAEMLKENQHKDQWNRKPEPPRTGKNKWFPNRDEVSLLIAGLEEQIARIDERRARTAISPREYWLRLRNAVLTLCTLFCMWRLDTAATGSLCHLRRDPASDSIVGVDGFAAMDGIARAKNSSATWYPFVPTLLLPPNVLGYLEKLLACEGRSLRDPLREGEEPIHLTSATAGRKADRWGHDPILHGELFVVPIFRRGPHHPRGLSYQSVREVLRKQLRELCFGGTNPHVLRAAGAIYWRFIQHMPEEHVMTLGLWEDERTLRENYARLTEADKRADMAAFVPTGPGAAPIKPRGHREQVAAQAIGVLTAMLERPTSAPEARRLLADLQHHAEEIDQTIAAELGARWEPFRAERFQAGEDLMVDQALRERGVAGIAAVIGRDYFATDSLRTRAVRALKDRRSPTLPLRRVTQAPRALLSALPMPANHTTRNVA